MKKHLPILSFILLICIGCNSAEKTNEQQEEGTLKVSAVNYPLYYFGQAIGGDYIEMTYSIPNDVDPAYWVPNDQSLASYQASDIIFTNGADYAKWLKNVSLAQRKLVNTSKDFQEKYIEVEVGNSHSHGNGDEHVHMGYAFTTWLDFGMAMGQAEVIKMTFEEKTPSQQTYFKANFEELKSALNDLDFTMKQLGNQLKGQTLYASHPVYQYLAKAYGLEVISEHWEPGAEVSGHDWEHFKEKLEDNPSKIMLWEGEPSDTVRKQLEDLGMQVVIFNPCATQPMNSDFISVMSQNVSNLESAVTAMQ